MKNKIDTKTIIEFNKRFANGEQNIYIDIYGNISPCPFNYSWQKYEIYNRIKPALENIKIHLKNKKFYDFYKPGGVVEDLIPLQRRYNELKNKKLLYINKSIFSPVIVEDGSIDVDTLEEDGLNPGKILVYRQGAKPPIMINFNKDLYDAIEKEEVKTLEEFENIVNNYIKMGVKNNETN